MKKLFSVLDEVEKFLTTHPTLRDNDEKLMANIWYNYIGTTHPNANHESTKITANQLLKKLADGELPSYESISRCRRKLQEECPNLRGEKWYERHKRADNIRREIVA